MVVRGLKQCQVGEVFDGYCIIRKKELKYKKDGSPYLKMELGDSTGRLIGKIWNKTQERWKVLKVGQVVKIRGKICLYGQYKQINIDQVSPERKNETFIRKNLLPVSQKSIEALRRKFCEHQESIKNRHLKNLLTDIFSDAGFLETYLQMPSGKLWHHHYLYGTLEHVVCLLDLSDIMATHYPLINLDLLKAGIFLRFLGKIDEFEQDGFINYSGKGRLFGGAILSVHHLNQHMTQQEDFPEELKLQLTHLLLSNESGAHEKSPVQPMTREAISLKNLIRLDIEANAVERIIQYDYVENSDWTKFNPLLNRFIYCKRVD
ncbi:MAG: hypothetical protein JSW33_10900 [bacterium]|nr:MAG: hypothetical protein JSW33_10900 [bacterium]